MIESPQRLLLRKAQEYLDKEQLLKAIAQSAQPTQGGYLVSAELIERLRQALAA